MAGNGGPPNKWVKGQVSTTSDPNAETSDTVLGQLNNSYGTTGAATVVCSDGTFVFVAAYGS